MKSPSCGFTHPLTPSRRGRGDDFCECIKVNTYENGAYLTRAQSLPFTSTRTKASLVRPLWSVLL